MFNLSFVVVGLCFVLACGVAACRMEVHGEEADKPTFPERVSASLLGEPVHKKLGSYNDRWQGEVMAADNASLSIELDIIVTKRAESDATSHQREKEAFAVLSSPSLPQLVADGEISHRNCLRLDDEFTDYLLEREFVCLRFHSSYALGNKSEEYSESFVKFVQRVAPELTADAIKQSGFQFELLGERQGKKIRGIVVLRDKWNHILLNAGQFELIQTGRAEVEILNDYDVRTGNFRLVHPNNVNPF